MTAGCFPDRDRVLPSGTGPPCGNPIPVGHALDGAPPASVVTHTTSSLAFRLVRSGHRLVGRHPSGPALSAGLQSWRTTSDAPCRAPKPSGNPACLEEPGPLPPSSRQRERFSRPRAPFLDKCSPTRLECCFRSRSGLWEPATDLAALPPTIRLPTLFHPPGALAWGG